MGGSPGEERGDVQEGGSSLSAVSRGSAWPRLTATPSATISPAIANHRIPPRTYRNHLFMVSLSRFEPDRYFTTESTEKTEKRQKRN
jgi:hypothetical protein